MSNTARSGEDAGRSWMVGVGGRVTNPGGLVLDVDDGLRAGGR